MGIALLDHFERPNSTSDLGRADSGQSWIQDVGTWGLTGGRAYTSVANTHATGVGGALAQLDVGHARQDVIGVIQAAPANNEQIGILARYVDTTSHWFAIFYTTAGGVLTFYAGKAVSNVQTYSIANGLGVSPTFPAELRLVVDDLNTWRAFINGAATGSTVTDSALSTATKAGLDMYNSTGASIAEFKVLTPAGAFGFVRPRGRHRLRVGR